MFASYFNAFASKKRVIIYLFCFGWKIPNVIHHVKEEISLVKNKKKEVISS